MNSRLHWTLEGHRFSVTYAIFVGILGFVESDRLRVSIDTYDPSLETDWSFMYEDMYAAPKHGICHGTYHSMIPYYRVLNNLIKQTLSPKVGDHTSILSTTKAVMFAMQLGVVPFRVFEFL